MIRIGCQLAVMGAILVAGSWQGAAQADSGSKEREHKKKIELMVVEKKQSEKPARNSDSKGSRRPDRTR